MRAGIAQAAPGLLPPASGSPGRPLSRMDTLRQAATRPLPPVSASEVAGYTEQLDAVAIAVMRLPERRPTVAQARLLRTLARELERRST